MRTAIVGLSVATVAFGGSTIYLGQKLGAERERAAQVEQTTRKLNARIAELEKTRHELAQRRVARSAGFISGTFQDGESMIIPAPPPSVAPKSDDATQPAWTMMQRHEPSPAMQKMFRKQMRASNKRLYAEVGDKLGLSKDATNKLIDLLTDQQTAGMNNFVLPGEDAAEARRRAEQTHRDNETAINDLIGADKAMALKQYQETIPARSEVESLVRQLESNDVRVSDEQRKKLVDVYIEERSRVPYPMPYEGIEPEAYGKSMMAWQDDYEKRVSAEAGRILESTQLAAFNEIQQWNQEMREQFRTAAGGTMQLQRGVPADATMFAAGGSVAAVSAVIENAPPPVQEKKQP